MEPRRVAWRLGRWTAKSALAARLGMGVDRVEVIAAADGAPEAWSGGHRLPASVTLSHRDTHALAVVAQESHLPGCDLEIVEPRSDAFVRQWFAPSEQELIAGAGTTLRPLLANLIWTAKEAAAKARREGLRLDVRAAVVTLPTIGIAGAAWAPLRVQFEDRAYPLCGWWRSDPGWVMTVIGDPAPEVPQTLVAEGSDRLRLGHAR